MLVDAVRAQAMFDSLPDHMRWPTLSPDYVVADARRDASASPLFLVDESDDGLLLHAVLESAIPDGSARDWQSAYGYGGPLVLGLEGEQLARAWQRVDSVAMERGIVAEFVRFHPGLDNQTSYPGTSRADRAVVEIDLGVPDLLASYLGRGRTAVRKAQREGLQARWLSPEQALAQFPEFYRRSMAEIGAGEFYHFDDAYFSGLLTLPGARTLAITRGQVLLSMAVLLFGPVQVEYHLSGTSPDGRLLGATNLLLHTAAETAKAEGLCRLYLGGGTTSSPDDALLRFKSSFALPRHTFHIGYRVHDERIYNRLRDENPDRAARGRILFYRS